MSQSHPRILFVDDDANLLEGVRRQFRHEFAIAISADPRQCLADLGHGEPYEVLITDYSMPIMNGVDFLREFHGKSPDTVKIMLTGQSELGVAVAALHEGSIFRFLEKPCAQPVLRRAILDGLEQYRLIINERRLSRELVQANGRLAEMNGHLEQRVAERTATIARLHQFVTQLNGLESIADVADLVVGTTANMLGSGRVSLMLPAEDREYLSNRGRRRRA